MNIESMLASLQAMPLPTAVRGEARGTEWLFPTIEILHVFSLAFVFGTIAMIDLHLVGLRSQRRVPFSRLSRELLPLTWGAFGCAVVTGALMFSCKAVTYAASFQFQMKFVLMGLAGLNMLVFHFGPLRRVSEWDTTSPPTSARLAGALSLSCWIGVIFFGRWVGFTT